jgi:hypothetical protein
MKKNKTEKPKPIATIFSSFEEENSAEHNRLASLSPAKRLKEFGILQQRVWGAKWTKSRIPHIVKFEKTIW